MAASVIRAGFAIERRAGYKPAPTGQQNVVRQAHHERILDFYVLGRHAPGLRIVVILERITVPAVKPKGTGRNAVM